MKTIRAKVQVQEHRVTAYNSGQKTVVARPVYATEIPEDQRFAAATPSGEITLLMKSEVADQFELGKQYYVDFTPVPTEQSAS